MTTHPTLRVAAAQSCSQPGDIAANLQTHLRFIAAARQARAELLLFPELSLSGYEPTLVRHYLLEPSDEQLAPIKDLAREAGMTIVVGAPVASQVADKPCIGAISFYPDGSHSVYRKQHLHPGEEGFATPGPVDASNPNGYMLGDTAAALAICADSMHPPHAQRAATAGAALYLASSLVSVGGFESDARQLQQYAQADRATEILVLLKQMPAELRLLQLFFDVGDLDFGFAAGIAFVVFAVRIHVHFAAASAKQEAG